MNDTDTTGFNNYIRLSFIVAVDAQVCLLGRMRDAGLLPRLRDGKLVWNGKKWEVKTMRQDGGTTFPKRRRNIG